ncbi:MAG TPA: class I SAM-dependent methyltransferase, partial [Elusimicrobiales bacterium]|nr:class I SAM-dependent methyltransferase [Elusimicrobiales bacterium]
MDTSIITQPYSEQEGILLFAAANRGEAAFEQELQSWDKNAAFYLQEVGLPLFLLLHRSKLLTYELDKEGPRLLDAGGGTGFFCGSIASLGKETVVLDFSFKMLRTGREHYKADLWVNASVSELPFADASFDIVLANGALHHFKAENLLERSVRELARVLKPGGAL